MATATERSRLRSDIGADVTSLPDVDADAIYTEAAESHSDARVVHAEARVIAIRRLLASSARLTSYRQNNSTENLSDVFKHLQSLLGLWEGNRDRAVAEAGSGAARFGGVRPRPAAVREYPYGS